MLCGKIPRTKDLKKENEKPNKACDKNEVKKKNVQRVLQLWDVTHSSSDRLGLNLQPSVQNISDIGMSCVAFVSGWSLITQSFNASDSYTWYCLLMVATFYIWDHLRNRKNTTLYVLINSLQVSFLQVFPFRYTSRLWGNICRLKIAPRCRAHVYGLFIKVYGVKMEEAKHKDLVYYKTMGDFFRRKLDSKLRPISKLSEVVSPVDGTVLSTGVLANGLVEQIKGVNYSIKKFLGPLRNTDSDIPLHKYQQHLQHHPGLNKLYSCVIYLSPGDYHRFHSPVHWTLLHRRHFVGDLLSVNPRVVAWLPDLFVSNERVVLSGVWKHGFFSMTAVGATNVGSIVIYKDKKLRTNDASSEHDTYSDVEFTGNDVSYKKGDYVGEFQFGSTIVLIYEAPNSFDFRSINGLKVKYGEALLKDHC